MSSFDTIAQADCNDLERLHFFFRWISQERSMRRDNLFAFIFFVLLFTRKNCFEKKKPEKKKAEEKRPFKDKKETE
jgi:hypothetical protein